MPLQPLKPTVYSPGSCEDTSKRLDCEPPDKQPCSQEPPLVLPRTRHPPPDHDPALGHVPSICAPSYLQDPRRTQERSSFGVQQGKQSIHQLLDLHTSRAWGGSSSDVPSIMSAKFSGISGGASPSSEGGCWASCQGNSEDSATHACVSRNPSAPRSLPRTHTVPYDHAASLPSLREPGHGPHLHCSL